ncbi:hypothetical protein ACWDRX_33030, partial [Streptomyces nigra]
MANVEVTLKEIMAGIEGALGAAVVDYTSGMALGTLGGGKDLDAVCALFATAARERAEPVGVPGTLPVP